MDRREFVTALAAAGLTGCGGDSVDYEIQQSPRMRSSHNVYDWGVEGSWTPSVTFQNPGDLSVVYSIQKGYYRRQGSLVTAMFDILTSTFTHTTALDVLRITGFPYIPLDDALFGRFLGALRWQGITKAGYTDASVQMSNNQTTAFAFIVMCASATSIGVVGVADVPSGGTVNLTGSIMYHTNKA